MRTQSLFFILSFLVVISASGQKVVDVDKFEGNALNFLKTVGGEPMVNTKFVKVVDGTPYFSEKWMKGNVIIEESEYRNILLRVNILETTLEFMDNKGEAMVCTMPIKQVILNDSVKGIKYRFVHSSFLPDNPELRRCWLLELVPGQAGLYKFEKKTINENRPYGSATTEQRIIGTSYYYILFNKELIRVKKTADIPDILVSQKQALQEYIKSNRLSAKDEKDMTKLVNYFNTL
jgi:hypothetical protein